MDTTIADQARLRAGIVRGEGLSAASRALLVRPQLPIHTRSQFPTLTAPPADWPQTLSAGPGVVAFRDRSGPAWFKAGHDDGTANKVVCMEAGLRCVVLLANDMPWGWEYAWYR